jgi:hypothetical protein
MERDQDDLHSEENIQIQASFMLLEFIIYIMNSI